MNIQKEREALVAEIEIFIAEAMKAYVVERWADSYQNTEPFAYTIDDKNEVWWMKTQAHQLWQFWKSAKAHESEKIDGCVVVPVEMPDSFDDALYMYSNDISVVNSENDGFIPMADLDHGKVWKLMVEAARGGNHE